jgi:hypothetical protein
MRRKPFAAFGRVLYANYYDKGDVVEVLTHADSKIVLFFSEGNFTARDKQTGETVLQCDAGWFSYGDHQDKLLMCTANDPTVCWCYDPEINQGYVPPISTFVMKQGQSVFLDANTNLFLCGGSLQVNDREYTGPYQLAVRTNGNTATALTDVYGLLFR